MKGKANTYALASGYGVWGGTPITRTQLKEKLEEANTSRK